MSKEPHKVKTMNATDSKGSHLYICILPSEQDALVSYRLLQKNGFSPANVAIVGKGYRSPDDVGFAEPKKTATQRAKSTAVFAGLVGAFSGAIFNKMTGIPILGNPLVDPFLGAVLAGLSGLLGGFLVGGGVGFIWESGESVFYRNRLERGSYILMVESQDESLVKNAAKLLSEQPVQSAQRYYFRD